MDEPFHVSLIVGRRHHYITKGEFEDALRPIRRALMSQQDELDALGAQIDEVSANLQTELADVQSEIDSLASQAPAELDFSTVQQKLQSLSAQVDAVSDLKPSAPADATTTPGDSGDMPPGVGEPPADAPPADTAPDDTSSGGASV